MEIHLAVFGAFRAYAESGTIELLLPEGAAVTELRAALVEALSGHPTAAALVECSVFADSDDILAEADKLDGRTGLAVLPPVSGG